MSRIGNIAAQVSGIASQVGSILGAAARPTGPDDVTLTVGSQIIGGWQRIRITRSIERLPMDFDIELTENFPGQLSLVTITPQQLCEVRIGGDLVCTGYVDRYNPRISHGQHSIAVTGRSKCQDLVDCSAEWPGGQISGTSAADIASKLAAPYGLLVTVLQDPSTLPAIPQFNLNPGESASDIIERITRYSNLLYYDDVDGNLILSQVDEKTMAASGFTEGINVEDASAMFTADQRFRDYLVTNQATAVLQDVGEGWSLIASSTDAEVIRNRKKIMISEATGQDFEISQKRATWEMNRRYGRSYQLDLTTDSWRDSSGKLWTPNTLVPLNLPSMKMTGLNYTIAEVTYSRDDAGTHARLVLMPPRAFTLQPIILQPKTLFEAGFILTPPGGNQNVGAPNLFPAKTSPANSPGFSGSFGNGDGTPNQAGIDAINTLYPPGE